MGSEKIILHVSLSLLRRYLFFYFRAVFVPLPISEQVSFPSRVDGNELQTLAVLKNRTRPCSALLLRMMIISSWADSLSLPTKEAPGNSRSNASGMNNIRRETARFPWKTCTVHHELVHEYSVSNMLVKIGNILCLHYPLSDNKMDQC